MQLGFKTMQLYGAPPDKGCRILLGTLHDLQDVFPENFNVDFYGHQGFTD